MEKSIKPPKVKKIVKELSNHKRRKLARRLRRAGKRAQRDLKLINKWMDALNYDRARRRNFLRELLKSQRMQDAFFEVLNQKTTPQRPKK